MGACHLDRGEIMRGYSLGLAIGVLIAVATPAPATVVNGTFTGTIYSGSDPIGVFGAAGSLVGATVRGAFSYDTALLTTPQGCDAIYRYACASGIGAVTMSHTLNGVTVTFDGSHESFLKVVDRFPTPSIFEPDILDQFYMTSFGPFDNPGQVRISQLQAISTSIDFITSLSLVVSFPNLTPNIGTFGGSGHIPGPGDADDAEYFFNLDRISASIYSDSFGVSEPPSFSILAAAFLMVIGSGILRSKRTGGSPE